MMKRKTFYLWFFINSLIISLIPFANLYSQEEIKTKEEMIEKLEKGAHLVAFRAFKQNNTAVCDTSDNSEECWDYVKYFVFIKALAEGQCDKINSTYSPFIDVCNALKTGRCSSLSGYKNSFCQGLLNADEKLIIAAFNDVDFPICITKRRDEKARDLLRDYSGFKVKSYSSCNKFSAANDSLVDMATCDMLFGKQSFEKNLDAVARDLLFVLKAKESGKKDSCSMVSDENIKKVCNDDTVSSFDDVLEIIWR